MKIKQKLSLLFILSFLFNPFLSFAQFIPTNSPCTLEVIPSSTQSAGVSCSYCRNKGDYLHLKWDIGGDFQNPVCNLGCWTANGNQCSTKPQLFNDQGKPKINLKPKDDVFVKNPYTNSASTGPGTNLQIVCYEQTNPSKSKTSAGIRVVGECGAQFCQERKFTDIINDLDSYKLTIITEKNFSSWSNRDMLDKSELGGSGELDDIKEVMIAKQCTGLSVITDNFNSYSDINLDILAYLQNSTAQKDAVPLGLIYYDVYPEDLDDVPEEVLRKFSAEKLRAFRQGGLLTEDNKFNIKGNVLGAHMVVSLGIIDHNLDYSKFRLKILDPNGAAFGFADCQRETWQAKFLNYYDPSLTSFLDAVFGASGYSGAPSDRLSNLIIKQPGKFKTFYTCLGGNQKSFVPIIPEKYVSNPLNISRLKNNAIRSNTIGYLSNYNNYPPISNFSDSTSEQTSEGVCAGWSDLTLRVAYLGKFEGRDCHPNGTFTNKNNSNLLALLSLFNHLLDFNLLNVYYK